MPSVDKTLLCSWKLGNPVYSSVSNTKVLSFKTGSKLQIGKTLEWNIRQISKSLELTWQLTPTELFRGGQRAVFWAVHTGEQNSGQVIRFRSAVNPALIIFESAVETDVRGQIRVNVGWNNPIIQDSLVVAQTIYSDWTKNSAGTPTGLYAVNRPDVILTRNYLPFYVFHEYKSSTDPKYIIRYLGYVVSPNQYYNGPRRPYSIEKIVDVRGAAIFETNFSGKPFNVTIRFRNGQKLSGILPNKAALAVIKNDNGNYQIGYVPYEAIPVYSGANVSYDSEAIKRNFKPLQ